MFRRQSSRTRCSPSCIASSVRLEASSETDGLDTEATRRLHNNDVFVPVDPSTLGARLESVGFTDVRVEIADHEFRELRFHARKPGLTLG